MKVRPKLRNYSKDDLDESYFAARSNGGEGDNSREDEEKFNEKCFYETEKREFKILDKKEKYSTGNEISTIKYSKRNFLGLSLVEQLSRPLNFYFVVMMLLQMVPWISLTDG